MKLEVIKRQEIELVEYWVLRGIKDTGAKKEVVAEKKWGIEPSHLDIAYFLIDHPDADFCSIEHNFRLKGCEPKELENWVYG